MKRTLCALLCFGLHLPALAQDRSYDLVAGAESETISVWDAEGDPKGVVIFGHGWGGKPESYDKLIEPWTRLGFTVEAPLNLDSASHPRNATLPPEDAGLARSQAIIGQRMVTMLALREAVAERGLPVVLAGHSFGAFVAMTNGEGKWTFGDLDGPEPVAVMAFSSPGAIPMLVTDSSYAELDLPYLMVTGTKDSSGATMPTWEVHRFAFDRSPVGDKYLAIVDGGEHNLVSFEDETLAAPIGELTARFLRAYALGDEQARGLLATQPVGDGITLEVR